MYIKRGDKRTTREGTGVKGTTRRKVITRGQGVRGDNRSIRGGQQEY